MDIEICQGERLKSTLGHCIDECLARAQRNTTLFPLWFFFRAFFLVSYGHTKSVAIYPCFIDAFFNLFFGRNDEAGGYPFFLSGLF